MPFVYGPVAAFGGLPRMVATPPSSILDRVGTWWFAQAAPVVGAATRLARELAASGVFAWAPAETILKREEDKQGRSHHRKIRKPLFPGYVFVCGDENDRYLAARSEYSCKVHNILNQARFVREMRGFEILGVSDQPVRIARPLAAGIAIEVTDGPLLGLRGYVDSMSASQLDVIVVLREFQMGRCVTMPAHYVEPI